MSKTLNAHHFLNIYQNILIFFFKKIALIQGIQLKKNFCSSTEPVLTTTQNDKNLDIGQYLRQFSTDLHETFTK